jgi:protein subunit release factor A
MAELKRRVESSEKTKNHLVQNSKRQSQIGSGQRGDKIRTYREKDDVVVCNKTGKKFRMSKIMNGEILSI